MARGGQTEIFLNVRRGGNMAGGDKLRFYKM